MCSVLTFPGSLPPLGPFHSLDAALPHTQLCLCERQPLSVAMQNCSRGWKELASYPGLFVVTQGRPGKTYHIQWRTWTLGRCVEEWHIPENLSALPTTTMQQMNCWHQEAMATFLGPPHSSTEWMPYSSHIHPMSRYVSVHNQFTRPSPCQYCRQ